jgi:hypothetical protein
MKAENIQSNTSAPFLAGRSFGTFHTEQDALLVNRLIKDAKAIHCAQDLKDYCQGYKETLAGTNGSKETRTSMVRTILKVATGLDKKLCEYHKVKTPAAGQKVVQKHMDKGAKGIDRLAKALRIPSAGKAEGDGDSEGDTGTNEAHDTLSAWWAACEKLGHSDKYGLTTDEMLAHIAQVLAK